MIAQLKAILFATTRFFFWLKSLGAKNISFRNGLKIYNSNIRVGKQANLKLGENVTIMNSRVEISGSSKLEIGGNSILKNVTLAVGDESTCFIDTGVILRFDKLKRGSISLNTGHLKIDSCANLACNISIRFGSNLSIGTYTSLGYDSEIVCDRSITIGKYVLISNNVDIYDTNSHSVNHDQRRNRIEIGYPIGCSEIEPPDTSPISIGDDVWIGKGSMVLKGVTIGNRSIVGMGTKVTRGVYPDDCIIVNEKSRSITT